MHGALTPLPSAACETRTKGANSLSNTNNCEQTSWACSLFCREGSTDSDPLRSHSLSRVTLLGLALLAAPASASPLGPHGLESRSLAHRVCDRQRRTLGRNYSKWRRAWHPALGSSSVQRFQRVSTVSASSSVVDLCHTGLWGIHRHEAVAGGPATQRSAVPCLGTGAHGGAVLGSGTAALRRLSLCHR